MTQVHSRVGTSTPRLDPAELVAAYRVMVTSRAIDDQEIRLKRQNLFYFQISGAGHEAVLIAIAARATRPGYDWFYPYYRDRALCLMLGMTPTEMLMSAVGAVDDPNSHGRQMPSHWGHKTLNIVSQSSPTGTQMLQAVGCAEAATLERRLPGIEPKARLAQRTRSPTSRWETEPRARASSGRASTPPASCGSRSSSMSKTTATRSRSRWSSRLREEASRGSSPASRISRSWRCDGTDPVESHAAAKKAVASCRSGKGPALIHSHVTRPYSHSLSDDHRAYRSKRELEEEESRDCLRTLRAHAHRARDRNRRKILARDSRGRHAGSEGGVGSGARGGEAPTHRGRKPSSALYSPNVDPTGDQFDRPPAEAGEPDSIVGLVNACLKEEMGRDPRIVMFGEDVADATRCDVLSEVAGKGGVFKVTHKLQAMYGPERVFNSPLAEANIVGRAIGMATRGLKPVVEIQFFDYIWPAFMQIRNELTMMRWRSRGGFSCPMVIRVPIGGYLQAAERCTTRSPASVSSRTARESASCMPSNALDANGLLRTAVRCDDPVLFLEHKHLYRQPYAKRPYPGKDHCIPFGKARLHRAGRDLTIVTYGALVRRSEMAAKELAKERNRGGDPRSALALPVGLRGGGGVGEENEPLPRRATRTIGPFGFGARSRGVGDRSRSSRGSTRPCGGSPPSTCRSPTPRTSRT